MPDTVYVERDGTIATIILNRPERLNALDVDMAALLVRHLQGLAHDDDVSSIIITGAGRAFCAGGDLGWAAACPGGPASGFHVLASHLHQALLEIHRTGKPVIAAVNGVAAGAGFSLALACDFRVLDEAATFGRCPYDLVGQLGRYVPQASYDGRTREPQSPLSVPALLAEPHQLSRRVDRLGEISQKIFC